jgi:glucosamine--fructose-6-phosphate aminotransferase (isomerizing)
MGSSLDALYPTYVALAAAGVPAWHVETGELLHHMPALVTSRTLLWVASQSGRSAEVVALLDEVAERRPALLALTNATSSPLATSADAVVDIAAGSEGVVATKTWVNTVAASALLVDESLGSRGREELVVAARALREHLSTFEERVEAIDAAVRPFVHLIVLGRGPSLGTAVTASLTLKEATRTQAEAMTMAGFRHGPFELVGPDLTLLLLPGDGDPGGHLARLASDAAHAGTQVGWLGDRPPDATIPIATPQARGAGRPIVELVPLQLLAVALARRAGIDPGRPRHIEKVTSSL